jgi:hypothetical protein
MTSKTAVLPVDVGSTPVLRTVREAKVRDLLADLLPGMRRFEASGVVATDGALWVIFDNTSLIARLDPALEPGRPGNRVLHPPGCTDYEDIGHDRVDGTYYVLVEAVKVSGTEYKAQVHEYTPDFVPIRTRLLDYPLPAANKGIEGLTCVRREGRVHLLGMCEGNRCQAGREGRRPGGGRIHVFVEDGDRWQSIHTIRLPKRLPFVDYSSLSVSGDRVAVVSQESSALWLGRLSSTSWDLVDDGVTFLFPRTRHGRIRYGTVEGVTWLDEQTLAVVSDRAKPDQPRRMRATDQSVHIMTLPPAADLAS